ncbi:4421_t:CDS:2 [Acaulospora morrowiae]|uniref:Small ribosomal subunit protein uS9m n=1 Tax=Acaulospora morrowiae TaxID=94023 RepID=A0A9N8W6W1_9GLOM|nr:4421_t:CDS:2 [Acaulospora morrowiae]
MFLNAGIRLTQNLWRSSSFKHSCIGNITVPKTSILRCLATSPGQTLQLKTDELDILMPRERPESISYFTAKPTYNDLLIQLNELVTKYKNYKTAKRDDKNISLWKLKNRLEVDLGVELKFNQYDIITKMLHRLDAVVPESAPELHEFLDLFRRQDPEKAKKELQANKKLDEYQRAYSVGKRKEAVAHVWVVEGEGQMKINGEPLVDYMSLLEYRERILMPFQVTNSLGKYNVWIRVLGGGISGQAGAIAHGISKCLLIHDPDLKPALRKAKLITRDSRRVERKKPGLAKARKAYTWVKR